MATLEAALPAGWHALPYDPTVQAAGARWMRTADSLALRVPSAVARGTPACS